MDRATELSIAFLETQPAGAARALEQIPAEDAAAFVEEVPEPRAAAVLGHMQPARAAAILEHLSPKRAATVLTQAAAPTRSVLLRAVSGPARDAALAALSKREAAALRRYLAYAPGTVGAWMDAPRAVFATDATVGDCLKRVRRLGVRLGSLVFVVDEERRLLGVVDVDGLLGAQDSVLLGDVMKKDFSRLSPQASLATVVSLPAWDRALSLPVVDRSRRLLGVLHFDSLREGLLADRRQTEGFQINFLVVHLVQAFLVALSGLLQTATTEPGVSRLTSDWEA